MLNKQIIALCMAFCCAVVPVMSQTPEKSQQDAKKEKRMEWFSNAKLGIFIHWGIYSVKGVSESWSFFNKWGFPKAGLSSINTFRMRNT